MAHDPRVTTTSTLTGLSPAEARILTRFLRRLQSTRRLLRVATSHGTLAVF
jgi:hypothetical protein